MFRVTEDTGDKADGPAILGGPSSLGAAGESPTRSTQDPRFGEVFVCDLRRAQSEAALQTELGRRLDVQLPSGAGPTVEALGSLLGARQRCCVVLDNFEELVEAGATAIALWLRQAPEARFLVTSRHVLRLQR